MFHALSFLNDMPRIIVEIRIGPLQQFHWLDAGFSWRMSVHVMQHLVLYSSVG